MSYLLFRIANRFLFQALLFLFCAICGGVVVLLLEAIHVHTGLTTEGPIGTLFVVLDNLILFTALETGVTNTLCTMQCIIIVHHFEAFLAIGGIIIIGDARRGNLDKRFLPGHHASIDWREIITITVNEAIAIDIATMRTRFKDLCHFFIFSKL